MNFPFVVSLVLALFGIATLVASAAESAWPGGGRKRGLLKVPGLRPISGSGRRAPGRRTTVALVGVIFGLPLGVAAGRAIWRAFAANLGSSRCQWCRPGILRCWPRGVLVVANALAIGPALVAGRTHPGKLAPDLADRLGHSFIRPASGAGQAVFLAPRSQSARGADEAIDGHQRQHVQTKHNIGDEDGGAADGLAPRANGPASCSRRRASETRVGQGISELALCGAGDENRTRTISLGSSAVMAAGGR